MSRILAITAVFAVLAAPAAARTSGGAQPASWAQPQIKVVVAHGLMAKSVQTFHPYDPLTSGALTALVSGLALDGPTFTTQSTAPVTMAQLDATLVRALGLTDAAAQVAAAARAAGLAPSSRFGTEVVARLLGLRTNHPAQLDSLELLPSQPATPCSGARPARPRSRPRSTTRGSTSATAGSSTRQATASRLRSSRAGTSSASRGLAGRLPKPR